ncbi:MAG: HAD family phosphatase [Pseudoflavonifractor sp.]|nr:HAD family phosphatase [Pseudoflavonifractor sp.]
MIKNLLFDLGGVIMDIKRSRCVEAFERLGLSQAGDLLDEYTQKGIFLEVEDGTLDADEFRQRIKAMIPHEVTDKEVDDAFCQFLVGIPRHRLAELRRLRGRYRIYLLSNTNPIMWHSRIAEEFSQEGESIDSYFDGMVTSFEAKAVKPDRRIFDEVVRKFGIKPTETLFLDDSQRNLDAAAALGFKTALVAPGTEFIDLIPEE